MIPESYFIYMFIVGTLFGYIYREETSFNIPDYLLLLIAGICITTIGTVVWLSNFTDVDLIALSVGVAGLTGIGIVKLVDKIAHPYKKSEEGK